LVGIYCGGFIFEIEAITLELEGSLMAFFGLQVNSELFNVVVGAGKVCCPPLVFPNVSSTGTTRRTQPGVTIPQ